MFIFSSVIYLLIFIVPNLPQVLTSTVMNRRLLHFYLFALFVSDEEYSKIMFSLQNGLRIAVVPLEESVSSPNQKLPKLNPFKLGKIARTFNI